MHTIGDALQLSEQEQELVRAATANQGALEIALRADTHGRAIVAGKKKFFDSHDRSVAEHYISLLVRLKSLELIRESATKKNEFELTNVGWALSRKLGR